MAREKKYEIDMSCGPMLINIIRFSVPLILTGMLQLLYNAADIVVVGRFAGSDSLAAVSSTSSLINLIINIFVGFSGGAAVLVARAFGAKNGDVLHKAVHTAISLSIIFGAVVGIIGFTLSKPMLYAMGSPENVIGKSALYLKIYFLGAPGLLIYNFGASVLRSVGDTKRPLYFSVLAGFVNIVLNLIFVIVFGLDVAGVAIATIVSQYLSAFLVVLCLIRSDGAYALCLKSLKIYKEELLEIIRMGLPAGLQGSLFSISNVLIQSSVNMFGSVAMAGCGAAGNLEGFVYIAMNALYQTSLTATSQNYGARDFKRIKKSLALCAVTVSAIGIILSAAVLIFPAPLLSIYSADPLVIEKGILRLTYIVPLYFTCGLMEVLVGSLRGMGYSVLPMIVSLLGACAFRILWIYTFFAWDTSLETLFISYPISWIITSAAHFICFIFAFSKRKKQMSAA